LSVGRTEFHEPDLSGRRGRRDRAAAHAALLAIDHCEPGAFNVADPNDEAATDKATAALGWRADFRMDRA